jgi:hypothetical protein
MSVCIASLSVAMLITGSRPTRLSERAPQPRLGNPSLFIPCKSPSAWGAHCETSFLQYPWCLRDSSGTYLRNRSMNVSAPKECKPTRSTRHVQWRVRTPIAPLASSL